MNPDPNPAEPRDSASAHPTVGELCRGQHATLDADQPAAAAAVELHAAPSDHAAVVDRHGHLAGVVSEGQLRAVAREGDAEACVRDAATQPTVALFPETRQRDAAAEMDRLGAEALPVLGHDQRVRGVVERGDV